jgi:hypothetical protein
LNDKIRGFGQGTAPADARYAGLTPAEGAERPEPIKQRRFRDRLPTRAQLEALIQNGHLVLPMRYFRGYFLDVLA